VEDAPDGDDCGLLVANATATPAAAPTRTVAAIAVTIFSGRPADPGGADVRGVQEYDGGV